MQQHFVLQSTQIVQQSSHCVCLIKVEMQRAVIPAPLPPNTSYSETLLTKFEQILKRQMSYSNSSVTVIKKKFNKIFFIEISLKDTRDPVSHFKTVHSKKKKV